MEESSFDHLSAEDKIKEIFIMSKKTYDKVQQYDPIIKRVLDYEDAGKKTGKWIMRVFTGGIIAGITIWITNHFGK